MQCKHAFVVGINPRSSGNQLWHFRSFKQASCPRRPFPRACVRVSMRVPEGAQDAIQSSMASTRENLSDQTEPSAHMGEADSSKIVSIKKQVEFWFSPSNLRRDWYLRRQMDSEGWMDPAVFLNFNRLKQMNASLADVVEACRLSPLFEVTSPEASGFSFGDNLGQTRVRRSMDLPPWSEHNLEEMQLSIIAHGVPTTATVDTLREIFEVYGEVTYMWISKSSPKSSHRHAIISFQSDAVASSALNSFKSNIPPGAESMSVESKLSWDAAKAARKSSSAVVEVDGLAPESTWRQVWNELLRLAKTIGLDILYFLYRNGESKCHVTFYDRAAAEKAVESFISGDSHICDCAVTGRILTDPVELEDYWKKALLQMLERQKRKAKQGSGRPEGSETPQRVIVRINNLADGLDWKTLKATLENFGPVVFLNFQAGAKHCHARFTDTETAQAAVSKLSGQSSDGLLGAQVEASILRGEEEKQYWRNAQDIRKRKAAKRVSLDESSSTVSDQEQESS